MTYLVLYIYLHYYHTGQYLQKEYSDGGGSVYVLCHKKRMHRNYCYHGNRWRGFDERGEISTSTR